MNCDQACNQLGFHCQPVADGLIYVESPLALSFDGMLIGAYIQDLGRGLVRITDNADIIFTAMTHGLKTDKRRARSFERIARNSGIDLSENGELHTTCRSSESGFFFARFIEAACRIGDVCDAALVVPAPKFESTVGRVLASKFKKRVKRSFVATGASGHQLTFPFVLDQGTDHQMVIQAISSGTGGKPNWGSIYGTIGKMGDLRNGGDTSRRTIILEDGDEDTIQQATVALAEIASIIIYDGDNEKLEYAIKAAA